jgi:hypothetical protein
MRSLVVRAEALRQSSLFIYGHPPRETGHNVRFSTCEIPQTALF